MIGKKHHSARIYFKKTRRDETRVVGERREGRGERKRVKLFDERWDIRQVRGTVADNGQRGRDEKGTKQREAEAEKGKGEGLGDVT